MERDPWFRTLIVFGVIALAIHLSGQIWGMVSHFSDIIIVFFLAWLLSFILSPLALGFERKYRIPRGLAVSIVYLLMFVIIAFVFVMVVPLAAEQFVQLIQGLPGIIENVQSWIVYGQSELEARGITVDLPSFLQSRDLATQIGSLGTGVLTNTITLVGGIASVLFNFTIILVISFYLVLDGDKVIARVNELVPMSRRIEGQFFFESINRTFGGFLRGTLIIALAYSIGNALVMFVFGLNYILLASILAGFLMIIPIIGSALAMILPMLLVALNGDITSIIFVLVSLLILQLLVFNVLSPKVMGNSVGLHPLLVFLALLLGIKQAGFVGALFGVPVVGVIYAMLIYFLQRRVASAEAPLSEPTVRVRNAGPLGFGWIFDWGRMTLRVLADEARKRRSKPPSNGPTNGSGSGPTNGGPKD